MDGMAVIFPGKTPKLGSQTVRVSKPSVTIGWNPTKPPGQARPKKWGPNGEPSEVHAFFCWTLHRCGFHDQNRNVSMRIGYPDNETNSKRTWTWKWMDGWKTLLSFWGNFRPIFRGKLAVSFRGVQCFGILVLGCCSERDLVHGVEHRPDTICSCLVSRMFVFHTYLEDVPIDKYLCFLLVSLTWQLFKQCERGNVVFFFALYPIWLLNVKLYSLGFWYIYICIFVYV